MRALCAVIAVLCLVHCTTRASDDTVRIAIGYQSPTAQTWGALVIKHERLLEKRLQAIFPGRAVAVEWRDFIAGALITNNMVAGKLDAGFMGDMPLLLNAARNEDPSYSPVVIGFDGKGASGKNQGIITSADGVRSLGDLAGKTVSTPFGSSAHRMALAILAKEHLLDRVTLVHQDVATGLAASEEGSVAAHATWDPYPRLAVARGRSRILADGSASGVDYLAGVIVNRRFAAEHRQIVSALAAALIDAHRLIREDPAQAASIFAEESKFPLEVCRSEAEQIRWDALPYEKDYRTLDEDVDFLKDLGRLRSVDVAALVDASFLREGAALAGAQYPASAVLEKEWRDDAQL